MFTKTVEDIKNVVISQDDARVSNQWRWGINEDREEMEMDRGAVKSEN